MKILHIADFHYTLKQWDWLARVVEGEAFDLVINAGDLLDIASIVETEVQVAVTLKYVATLAVKSAFVVSSGNHDGNTRDPETGERVARWLRRARREGARIDGESFEAGEALVTVCPWWDGPKTRESITALLEGEAPRAVGKRWIWVHHAPPQGSPASWTGRTHFGDTAVAAWIERFQPSLVLSGHVHQAPFARDGSWIGRIGETWIFNPGRQIGPVPTHIIIETDLGTAEWYSLAGNERADLNAVPFAGVVEF